MTREQEPVPFYFFSPLLLLHLFPHTHISLWRAHSFLSNCIQLMHKTLTQFASGVFISCVYPVCFSSALKTGTTFLKAPGFSLSLHTTLHLIIPLSLFHPLFHLQSQQTLVVVSEDKYSIQIRQITCYKEMCTVYRYE